MKSILIVVFTLFSFSSFSQVTEEDCSVMQSAIKLYEKSEGNETSFYVIRDGIWFYEFTNAGRQYIKSRMEWQPNCIYQLTMVETNIPDFDLNAGATIQVRITEVEGNQIKYEYLPEGLLPSGVLVVEE